MLMLYTGNQFTNIPVLSNLTSVISSISGQFISILMFALKTIFNIPINYPLRIMKL